MPYPLYAANLASANAKANSPLVLPPHSVFEGGEDKGRVKQELPSPFLNMHPNAGVVFGRPLSPFDDEEKKKCHKKTDKVYVCSACPYSVNRQDKLRVHVQAVHSDDKPYSCEYCHKGFKQRDKMTRHVDCVHLKHKPHCCEYCQATFGRKDKVKRHVATVHFGEKPYRCNFCTHKTSRRDKMRIHLQSVHSRDGTEFYEVPKEEAVDGPPPLPLSP